MRFRLAPRLMTLNDLELLQVRISWEFRVISLTFFGGGTPAKRM